MASNTLRYQQVQATFQKVLATIFDTEKIKQHNLISNKLLATSLLPVWRFPDKQQQFSNELGTFGSLFFIDLMQDFSCFLSA